MGRPVLTSTLPSDVSRSVTATWGRLPPWTTAPKVVVGKSDQVRPSSIDWKDARITAHIQHRMESRTVGVVVAVGDEVPPVGHDRAERDGLVELDRVGIGRRVVVLAEDGIGQVVDVARDVHPLELGVGGVVAQGDRVLDVEDAPRGDGVGVVAAADGVGDDRLDGSAAEAQRDVQPVVAGAAAAAAAVLTDVDLVALGADVHEVAQVAETRRGIGIGRTVGQRDTETTGTAEDGRVADIKPGGSLVGRGEDPARRSS